jgi:4-amino-4-deoxy-L-arabinose transferase-like glycosyltransferase
MLATDGVSAVAPNRGRIASFAPDAIALAALIAGAAAARYPNLWTVPRFRDETFNALRSLAIYRGQLAPLTDVELYMGSFFNYVVAAAFFVLGPSIYVARLVVTGFGVATVAATYALGREVGGRWVGLIAALFLLTNGIHIAAMGHVGFSANIMPFFTTVGLWLLHRALVRASGRTLAVAGFFFGMGLHTHPIAVGFLPGALGWFLWKGWRWLRTPWPYAAALLFLLAYSPMIAYNIQTGGQSVRHATYTANERPDYARNRPTTLTPEVYLDRQGDYWLMSYQTLGGALDGRDGAADYLRDPFLLATAGLALAGMAWAAWRGYSLPLWLVASFSLILPIFNASHYDVVGDGRYVAPALPLVYASMGLLVVDAARATRRRLADPRVAGIAVAALAAGVGLLVLTPLLSLSRYYAQASRSEPTNASLIRAMDEVKASRQNGEVVLLDDNLNDRKVEHASPWDEASTFRIFRFIMEFDQIAYEVVEVNETTLAERVASGRPSIVILAAGQDGKDTANLTRLIEQFGLRSLDGGSARAPRPADRYGFFRADPSYASGSVRSR